MWLLRNVKPAIRREDFQVTVFLSLDLELVVSGELA
jgi:hypothetical protein